jgi:hypothetical protein
MTTDSPRTQVISGNNLYIEITPEPDIVGDDQAEGTAGAGKAIDMAKQLGDVGDKIGEVCATLHTKALGAIKGVKPDEFEIEFGVTLAGEIGIPMVSKGSAECNFVVTAKWKNLGSTPANTDE